MTVQLTRKVILKISGQRPVGKKKYQRFQMEFPVSENCDKRQISAKLENGILYVKQPKLISSAEKKDKESSAEEQAITEKTTLRDENTKKDNAENTPGKEQAKGESKAKGPITSPPGKSPSQKDSTSTSEDGKTSSGNKPDESIDDSTTGTASNLLAKLKMQSQVMKMTVVALLILGIGGYFINVMKSSKKAKK